MESGAGLGLPARTRWAALLAVGALALAHALWLYDGFIEDDAFISFRYSERLVEGHGLSWTEGKPVEGYSDLAWVLLVALLDLVGMSHVHAARLLGGVGLVGGVAAASLDPRTLRPDPGRALSGGLLLALTGPVVAWSMGALEHTFLAGLGAMAALLLIRGALNGRGELWAAPWLGVAVLARADAPVLAAGLLLGAALATRQLLRWVWVGLLPLALLVGQQVHRVWWFEDWVPNTARVKVSGSSERAWRGIQWVARGLGHQGVLLAGALASLPLGARTPQVIIPMTGAVTWCAYVALVGGDIFAAWRQLVPALPLFAMTLSEAAVRSPLSGRATALLVAVAVALHLPLSNLGQDMDRARADRYEWLVPPMARALVKTWGDKDPLLAVDAAGVLPYATRFRSLDMLGLNDWYLPRHPPPGFGGAGIGHDLGDPDYVMRMQPDIVAFRSGLGGRTGKWASGRLQHKRSFQERYQLVKLGVEARGRLIEAHYYVRRDGGPLGMVVERDQITIPPWFLASDKAPVARLRGRTWGVKVWEKQPGIVPALRLPAGTWKAVTEPAEGVTVQVLCGGQTLETPFTISSRAPVDLRVSAAERTWVTGLKLERTEGAGASCP